MNFRNVIVTDWIKMKNNICVFRTDMPRIIDFKVIIRLRISFKR